MDTEEARYGGQDAARLTEHRVVEMGGPGALVLEVVT